MGKIFNKIKNDTCINNCYEQVNKPRNELNVLSYHGFNHVNNVIKVVEEILTLLEYDSAYIENAKIAALLHDIGMIKGKEGHAERSYEMAKIYFKENNIELKYEEEVLEAIKSHRNGFDSKNIMTTVLIFADKIDIKKTRLAPEGYNTEGL